MTLLKNIAVQSPKTQSALSKLLTGQKISLPTGEKIHIKIKKVGPTALAKNMTVNKYCYSTILVGGGISAIGVGADDDKIVAVHKSISEAVERLVFHLLKASRFGTPNSNGWAAHSSMKTAKERALLEMLERDAALSHWLLNEPLLELPKKQWPDWLVNWSNKVLANTKFDDLNVLISNVGFVPTATTVLSDQCGKSVMSHSIGSSLSIALKKSLSETCHLAHLANVRSLVEKSRGLLEQSLLYLPSPADHGIIYSKHLQLPTWIYGDKIKLNEVNNLWRTKLKSLKRNCPKHHFVVALSDPVAVVSCRSEEVQNLYFGPTRSALETGKLNLTRLGVKDPETEINFEPHFVA